MRKLDFIFISLSSHIALLIYFSPEEVNAVLTGKSGLKYVGSDIDALKSVASAAKKRSLADFTEVRFFMLSLQYMI